MQSDDSIIGVDGWLGQSQRAFLEMRLWISAEIDCCLDSSALILIVFKLALSGSHCNLFRLCVFSPHANTTDFDRQPNAGLGTTGL